MPSNEVVGDKHAIILDRKKSELITVPKEAISHMPPQHENRRSDKGPIKHPILCDRFHPLNPHSCMKGKNCNRVHAVIRGCPRKPVHINWAWRSLEECTYPRHAPGRRIEAREPLSAKSGVVDVFDSAFALKTRCVFDDPSRPAIHCAHFYYGRECHVAGRCDFAHIVYLNANNEKLERAPPPCAYGRRKTKSDGKKKSQTVTPQSNSLTKLSASTFSASDLTLSADDQSDGNHQPDASQYLSSAELSTSRRVFLPSNSIPQTLASVSQRGNNFMSATQQEQIEFLAERQKQIGFQKQQHQQSQNDIQAPCGPTRIDLGTNNVHPFYNPNLGSLPVNVPSGIIHRFLPPQPAYSHPFPNVPISLSVPRRESHNTHPQRHLQPQLSTPPFPTQLGNQLTRRRNSGLPPYQQRSSPLRSPVEQPAPVVSPLGVSPDTEQKNVDGSPCDTASATRAGGKARGKAIITRVRDGRWSFNPYDPKNRDHNESSNPSTPS